MSKILFQDVNRRPVFFKLYVMETLSVWNGLHV